MVIGILCTLDFNFIISFFLLTGTPTGVPIGKMFPEIGTTLPFQLLPLLLFSLAQFYWIRKFIFAGIRVQVSLPLRFHYRHYKPKAVYNV